MREGQLSLTALLIAAGAVQQAASSAAATLVPRAEAELMRAVLAERGRGGAAFLRAVETAALRRLIGTVERAVVPGLLLHFRARKLVIERETRRALAAGARQLLVIGAGFDALAIRLTREFPGLRAIEIDHPATQTAKHAALSRAGLYPPESTLTLVPADLGRVTLAEALSTTARFDPAAPTVAIAEGLLMYLDDPQVRSLLGACRDLPCPRLSLLVTAIDAARDAAVPRSVHGRLVELGLAALHEPLRWTMPRAGLTAYSAALGLAVAHVWGQDALDEALHACGVAPSAPLVEREYVALLERATPRP